jgi:hypothetical protein
MAGAAPKPRGRIELDGALRRRLRAEPLRTSLCSKAHKN